MYHSEFIDRGEEEFCCQFSDLQDHLWSPLTYDHQRFFNFFPFSFNNPFEVVAKWANNWKTWNLKIQ